MLDAGLISNDDSPYNAVSRQHNSPLFLRVAADSQSMTRRKRFQESIASASC
jgi:hypothetical protein